VPGEGTNGSGRVKKLQRGYMPSCFPTSCAYDTQCCEDMGPRHSKYAFMCAVYSVYSEYNCRKICCM